MADHSDAILAVWDALLTADEPAGWQDTPVVDMWALQLSPNEREIGLSGFVAGSDRFENGERLSTGALRAVDVTHRFVVTEKAAYRLGWPERTSLEADAAYVWPPALTVAACAHWKVAVVDAMHFTGEDTLPSILLTNLEVAGGNGDWPSRWVACREIGHFLFEAGRKAVAEPWRILEADLRKTSDRAFGARFVNAAVGQATGMYGRALTIDEALADTGWLMIGAMDDAEVGKLPNNGVPLFDPIAAARKVALIATRVGGGMPQKIEVEPEVQIEDGPADGVVVLKAVGGVDTASSGREAKKVFTGIEGKRLPVTPTPDIATARRALAAEFPYCMAQIDVILGDMVGAASARIRPTLLVGHPGCGKSRLARRIGEICGFYLSRYDGAGASDSTFGGTARRWSTGEPSVPLAALLAARRADALCILDELEKSATSRHNGSLADALLPFLEVETSRCYPDPFAQAEVDVSRVSYIATANDELALPSPLRDRFRLLRIPAPTTADLPALCRGVIIDLVRESGSDPHWFPHLDGGELDVVAQLWKGGSVRRLRDIVSRLVVKRADMPTH